MSGPSPDSRRRQLNIFLEEICCELCRYRHVSGDHLRADEVSIRRQLSLDADGSFADILVRPGHLPSYYVEVKYGYPSERLVTHLRRKYGPDSRRVHDASKLVLATDGQRDPDWESVLSEVRGSLRDGLELEVWDDESVRARIAATFGVEVQTIDAEIAHEIREAVDVWKWRYAFAGDHADSPLRSNLLWHFGFWRLRELHEPDKLAPWQIVPPGRYPNTVVLLADLSSFSSYVRDTSEGEIVRDCLTGFYSRGRHVVHNLGGMLYQFIGDELVALFGVPDAPEDYVERALECAKAMIDIGNSTSNEWQRRIDRIQPSGGVHMGMAIGDLETVSLRAFSRSQIGAVGDVINMAARLTSAAGPGELVVSNRVRDSLPERIRSEFQEMEPVNAKNVGLIKSWKFG